MITPPLVRKVFLTTFALLMMVGLALASGPVFWETAKQDDVVKGDARGVSIAENGAVTLAPAYTLVYDTKEAYIWSSTTDAAGNIYLGTGHDGKIFKVTAAGVGQMIYDAPELDVTALATDAQQNLYAADIKGASVALADHDLAGARNLLTQIAASPSQRDLRGWEWRGVT